jgi:serine/threonine protein kinase/tetratricopeptide (TPR) repeat protein
MTDEIIDQTSHLSALASVPGIALGTILADRYQIVALLGQGGMGVAYKARDLRSDQFVALKFLSPDRLANPKDIARFKREATTASKLQHSGIAHVLDFGLLEDSQPYLAMEFVAGTTLAQRIESAGQLPMQETVDVFIQVCDALAYAHANKVLHRDIKPSNIIVARWNSGSVQAKLLDFGIAKFIRSTDIDSPHDVSQKLTESGEILGSPFYMSPEQARGDRLDARSDLYSLGCALYESLTASPPHLGQTALATILKRETDKPLSMSEASLGKTFPAQLEAIVSKLLQTRPADRYQSALEVKGDLEKLSCSTSSEPASTAVTQRKGKFPPASKTLIIAATFCALAIPGLWWILKLPSNPIQKAPEPAPPAMARPSVANELTGLAARQSTELAHCKIDKAIRLSRDGDTRTSDVLLKQVLATFEKNPSADQEDCKIGAFSALAANCLIRHEYRHALDLYQSAWSLGCGDRTRADLATALATTNRFLGLHKKAYECSERAAALSAKHYGQRSKEYAVALSNSASLYMEAEPIVKIRQTKKVKDSFDRVISIAENLSGSDKSVVTNWLISQAQLYVTHKLFPEADERCKRALALNKTLDPSSYKDIGVIETDIATAYYSTNHNYALSISTLMTAIKCLEKQAKPDDLTLAATLIRLGDAYYDEGIWTQAADPKLFLSAVANYQRALPAYVHAASLAEVVIVHEKIGGAYQAASQCGYTSGQALAEASFRRAVQLAKQLPAAQAGTVAHEYCNLASICSDQQKYKEANTYFAQALKLYQKSAGANSADVVGVYTGMAHNLKAANKPNEALALYKRTLAMCNSLPKADAAAGKVGLLRGMGETYAELRNYKEAESAFLEARALLAKENPSRPLTIKRVEEALAGLHSSKSDLQNSSSTADTTSDAHI